MPENYEVIVIGAGINGAGIALDAALRGLSVLLLDKGDLASGTSAWSTRLIHGGLRYLEYGEIGLVRESLREREILLRAKPHLVKPLPMVVPLYGEPNRRSKWMIRTGMLAYDALSYDKSLPRHRFWNPAETSRQAPGLRSEKLKGAAIYYDAQVEFPERLIVENVLGARMRGAEIRTYACVERLITENGAVCGVEFTDQDGGHTARAPVVMNVAGPWVDAVLRGVSSKPLIGGTKGSHIVVQPFAGAPDGAVYVEARSDRRPFFIIPWNGLCLIGTTDLPFHGDLDNLSADESEIAYLLDETNWLFPDAHLTRDSVLYTYSGVRPLPFVEAGKPAGITRRHFIRHHAPDFRGLFSIVGGKLTTYRSLAEEATDAIFRYLGRPVPPCKTADDEGRSVVGLREKIMSLGRVSKQIADRLARVYGWTAFHVMAMPGSDEIWDETTGALAVEVERAFAVEMAQTLADVMLRRTMVGLGPHAGIGPDEKAARLAQRYRAQWSDERAAQEVAQYRAYMARFHPQGIKGVL